MPQDNVVQTPTTDTPPADSASSTPTNEPASASGDEAGFDFAALATDDDSGEDVAVSEPGAGTTASASPAAPPVVEPTQVPAVQAPAAQPAAAQPPAPSEPAPVQPQAPATEPSPATAAAEQMTFQQHREKFLPELEKLYALSDAEVESLQTNPGEALPKLAARLHYEVQMAAFQGILNVLPGVMGQHMQGYTQAQEYNRQFYDKHPALRAAIAEDPRREDAIVQSIKSYKSLHPKAPLNEVIEKAGLLAMISLGLPLDVPAAPQAPTGAPPQPMAPRQTPARPPGIGNSGSPPQPPARPGEESDNLYSDLAEAVLRGEI